MAFTVSRVKNDVKGSEREITLQVTTDSAEGTIESGLSFVRSFSIGPVSMADAAISIKANLGSTSTALNGFLGISGCGSGDVFFLRCYGR